MVFETSNLFLKSFAAFFSAAFMFFIEEAFSMERFNGSSCSSSSLSLIVKMINLNELLVNVFVWWIILRACYFFNKNASLDLANMTCDVKYTES